MEETLDTDERKLVLGVGGGKRCAGNENSIADSKDQSSQSKWQAFGFIKLYLTRYNMYKYPRCTSHPFHCLASATEPTSQHLSPAQHPSCVPRSITNMYEEGLVVAA